MILLNSVFLVLLGCALFFLFPIRNTVQCRQRSWATWAIIAVNLLLWVALRLAGVDGGASGGDAWFKSLLFTGDLLRPWTLVTAQFVHLDALRLLLLLWVFFLIGPVLEERLKPWALPAVYFGGGAAAMVVYGWLCKVVGARIEIGGIAPGFYVVLGLYLVLHPFDEIIFVYNILFFVFCGTFGIATIFLVAFALVGNALLVLLSGLIVLGAAQFPGAIGWLEEIVPLVGLAVGFAAGAMIFGLGAFVRPQPATPEGPEEGPPTGSFLTRALDRMIEQTHGPAESRVSRRERTERRMALADDAPPEQVEAFAEQCLRNKRDSMLNAVYRRFRGRFPDRSFGPGLLAATARRFEQAGHSDLAIDAYRLLIRSHGQTPVASGGRLCLARILARDPTAADEAIELLEDFLNGRPGKKAADEARRLLGAIIDATQKDDTYEGLSDYKTFRFSESPKAPESARPERAPVGPAVPARAVPPPAAPEPKPLASGEVVPDPDDSLFGDTDRPRRPAPSEIAAATASAGSFAVILLPGRKPIAAEAQTLLAQFWSVGPDEAIEQLRHCRGLLLDDAPPGRAVVLSRKLRTLGLPASMVPITPDIAFARGEDVLEFDWTRSHCNNVTATARRSFDWDQVRLANVGRVGLPGAGAAYRLVLDVFVDRPHCLLRYWENTLNFTRSRLDGRAGAAGALPALVQYLGARARKVLVTPSLAAVAKKSGPPLDFHSLAELDHYDRWFLYAGFGKYSRDE